jgi:hypothetical protein
VLTPPGPMLALGDLVTLVRRWRVEDVAEALYE